MPNFNYGKYLSKSLNSVLSQTYKNWELLIIDDGSTDNSLKYIKKFKKNKKIKIITQQNKGLNITNNIALRLSETDYIVRLDPDDYLDENFLNLTVNYLDENKNIDMVYPDYYVVNQQGKITNLVRYSDNKFEESLNDLPPHGACTVFRRNILISLGGYDESVSRQDGYDIWLKFIKKHKPHNIKIPLFYYRRHNENLTNNRKKIFEAKYKIVQKQSFDILKKTKNLAIIPVSANHLYDYNSPFTKLNKKPLIWYTLNAASLSANINKTIVNTRDNNVIDYVKKYFPSISIKKRNQSYENLNDIELVKDTMKSKKIYSNYDYSIVLYINTPLRRFDHIDHAISLATMFKTDKLISVSEELAQFYSHDKKGLIKINNISDTIRLERDSIYKENGSVYVYRNKSLNKNIKSYSTGHIQMLHEESVKINSVYEFKLAEFLLKYNEKN